MKHGEKSEYILDFQQSTYPYLEEVNESIVKQLPGNEDAFILDVGAGRGALAEVLEAKGYHVWAIESNEQAAREARMRATRVICADLHDMTAIHQQLNGKKFKYIIFADVLEHVFDPLAVLRQYLPLLSDDGKLLISLPNAVNWLSRLQVLCGRFNYQMTGVMDRTHVRFFTFKTAKKMLLASPCVIEKVDSTPFILRAFLPAIKRLMVRGTHQQNDDDNVKKLIISPYYLFYKKYIYPVEYRLTRLLPTLLAFNIILVARKHLK